MPRPQKLRQNQRRRLRQLRKQILRKSAKMLPQMMRHQQRRKKLLQSRSRNLLQQQLLMMQVLLLMLLLPQSLTQRPRRKRRRMRSPSQRRQKMLLQMMRHQRRLQSRSLKPLQQQRLLMKALPHLLREICRMPRNAQQRLVLCLGHMKRRKRHLLMSKQQRWKNLLSLQLILKRMQQRWKTLLAPQKRMMPRPNLHQQQMMHCRLKRLALKLRLAFLQRISVLWQPRQIPNMWMLGRRKPSPSRRQRPRVTSQGLRQALPKMPMLGTPMPKMLMPRMKNFLRR